MLAGRRYIVCRNREEMKKDAAARTAILAALERQLKKGDKTPCRQQGLSAILATPDDDHFVIDRAKAEEDAEVRRNLRAAHQRRSLAARNHALLQTFVDGGARVPNLEKPVRHAPDFP